MTKREVVEYLGKSKRTIETYIADGRLRARYFNGTNGKQAIFDRRSVEEFKREMEAVWVPVVKEGDRKPPVTGANGFLAAKLARIEEAVTGTGNAGSTALAPIEAAQSLAPLAQAIAAALREGQRGAPEPKPWLTLPEAAQYSGLPAHWLVAQARLGGIRAVNVGTGSKEFWRFNRAALQD